MNTTTTATIGAHTFAVTASGWPAPGACTRCDGSGFIPYYAGIYGGECFECDGGRKSFPAIGTRNATTIAEAQAGHVKALKARDRAHAKAAAKRDERAAERAAHQQANAVAERERADAKAAAEAAALAALTDVIPGRQVITGTVLGTKVVESSFGYRTTTVTKMIVLDDRGFKVYGTAPYTLAAATDAGTYAALRGLRVSFAAAVVAGSDFGFGFFTRPTKAALIG